MRCQQRTWIIWSNFLTDSLLGPPDGEIFSTGLSIAMLMPSLDAVEPDLARTAAAPVSSLKAEVRGGPGWGPTAEDGARGGIRDC